MSGIKTIKVVTVLGASGNMGCNVSALFAAFGDAKVYMMCRRKDPAYIEKAVKSVRADSIRKNLFLVDYSELEHCVKESDLVFESVAEDLALKEEINAKVDKFLRDDALFVTGTSGLSIEHLSKSLAEKNRSRYFGMHFFNPPYSMPLCELIFTKNNDAELIENTKQYLKKQLLRTVVVVNDRPAFLANRIGFFFINAALQLADQYKEMGGIDYIDAIFGTFTGRNMSPCKTADFVGLDVHAAIVNNVYDNSNDEMHEYFKLPEYVNKLIFEKKLGRKCGSGLFKTEILPNGEKVELVYDIELDAYRNKNIYNFSFSRRMKKYLKNGDYEAALEALKNDGTIEGKICLDLLKKYVEYSKLMSADLNGGLKAADHAMATGFNWCPPSNMSNLLFGTDYPVRYDYRSFFKAVN